MRCPTLHFSHGTLDGCAPPPSLAKMRGTACCLCQLQSEITVVAAGPDPIEFTRAQIMTALRSLTAACSTVELLRNGSLEF